MSWFVNLTDLHLVTPIKDESIDDHSKTRIVPENERQTYQHALKNTLKRLMAAKNCLPDAVILNGDITNIGSPDGFDEMNDILSELGSSDELKKRTVIVPGNHDIVRDTPPSSAERYENFIRFVNDHEFVAPALEGIHIDPVTGEPLDKGVYNSSQHYLLDEKLRWVIIPINCANYYGSLEPLQGRVEDQWKELAAIATSKAGSDLSDVLKYLTGLRRRDVARVSVGQMLHIESLLTQIDDAIVAQNADPLRVIKIAVIHHQLLPVSDVEELKPFEGLTNLGQFRQFLREHRFNVVLHGHKHINQCYWDYIPDFDEGADATAYRVLVVSGGSIRDRSDDHIGYVLELDDKVFAPVLSIADIPRLKGGRSRWHLAHKKYRLYESPELFDDYASALVISGEQAEDVYERLIALFDGIALDAEQYNVICQIYEHESVEKLADTYPLPSDTYPRDAKEWLDEVVSWWQLDDPSHKGGIQFNYGSRIRQFGGEIDQLAKVQKMLQGGATSKATITLLDPRDLQEENRVFPSLCSVQFTKRRSGNGKWLDCIGYFRKQEVRYWWPINIAELALLQQKVYEALLPTEPNLERGTLTTVAAIAVCSNGLPRVAIPAVDRAFDLKRDELWNMVYALFTVNIKDRKKYHELWLDYLADLMPPNSPDKDGVPVASTGLHYLVEIGQKFGSHTDSPQGKEIINMLAEIELKNETFAEVTEYGTKSNTSKYLRRWRQEMQPILDRLNNAITEIFNPADEAPNT